MESHSDSITVDSDFSDDLVMNEDRKYRKPSYSSSEEEEEYIFFKPSAPPPSPQEPCMIDMIFNEHKPYKEERVFMEHAQTLDKLLRKTLNQQQNTNKICKKRRTSWSSSIEKQQKFKSIMKAAAAEKFKKALIIDEETSLVIHELREMGL